MIYEITEIGLEDNGIDFENYKFEDVLKHYEGIEPVGYELLIRVYVQPKFEKIGDIHISEEVQDRLNLNAKFSNGTGLVVKKGRGVYKDTERYQFTGEFCEVGDWVQFARHGGLDTFGYNGWTTLNLKEDSVRNLVKDPRPVSKLTK